MNISPINSQNTNFKSSFPVIHWVAETNGSYAPVSNLKLVKSLQGKIVRMLNKPLAQSVKPMNRLEQSLRAYIGACDADYRGEINKVRSFYDRTGTYSDKTVSYIITGKDATAFDELYGKNIGRAKKSAKEANGSSSSPETSVAIKFYNKYGLNFAKASEKQIRDINGLPYILHTKFQIIRNKFGKIKDYVFEEARFMAADGSRKSLGRM